MALLEDSLPILSDEDIAQIERWGHFLTEEQLADVFSLTLGQLRRVFKRQPAVREAYQRTRAFFVAQVAETLLQKALQGDIKACQFYLKTQGGWMEKTRKEITGKDGGPIQSQQAAVLILPSNGRELDGYTVQLEDPLPHGTPLISLPAHEDDEEDF